MLRQQEENSMLRGISPRRSKIVVAIFAVFVLCSVSGCYEVQREENQSVYRYAWWMAPAIAAGGVLSGVIGYLWRQNGKAATSFFVFAFCATFLGAPTIFADRLVVDDDH